MENELRDSKLSSVTSRQSASGRPPLPPSNHRTDISAHNTNYSKGRTTTSSVTSTNATATPTQTQHQHQLSKTQFTPQQQQQLPQPQQQLQQHRSSSNSSPECKLDLPDLFSSYGLGKYTDLFQQQEVKNVRCGSFIFCPRRNKFRRGL